MGLLLSLSKNLELIIQLSFCPEGWACQSTTSQDRAAVVKNKEISQNLKKFRTIERDVKNLLLLGLLPDCAIDACNHFTGAGESGKSTIFKQLKMLHHLGYTVADRLFFSSVIHSNIVQALKTLFDASMSSKLADLHPICGVLAVILHWTCC